MITISIDLAGVQFGQIMAKLGDLLQQEKTIVANLADVKAAQAAEKADLATLVALVTQLLQAFANGTLSPADAQALVDEMTNESTGIKASITAIQAALGGPPVGGP